MIRVDRLFLISFVKLFREDEGFLQANTIFAVTVLVSNRFAYNHIGSPKRNSGQRSSGAYRDIFLALKGALWVVL